MHTQGTHTMHTQGTHTMHTQGTHTMHTQGTHTMHTQGTHTMHTQGTHTKVVHMNTFPQYTLLHNPRGQHDCLTLIPTPKYLLYNKTTTVCIFPLYSVHVNESVRMEHLHQALVDFSTLHVKTIGWAFAHSLPLVYSCAAFSPLPLVALIRIISLGSVLWQKEKKIFYTIRVDNKLV